MPDEIMTTITIRISKDEKDRLKDKADIEDLTMSQIIRKAIRQYLSE